MRIFHPGFRVVFLAITVLTCRFSWAATSAELWQDAVKAFVSRQYLKCAADLEQYLKLTHDPAKVPDARFFLAEAYRLGGAVNQALPLYRELASGAPSGLLKMSARFRQAELFFNQGDYGQAASLLNGMAGNAQADFLLPQIRLALVKTDLKLQRIPEAQRVFSDLLAALPRALLDPEIKFLFGIMHEYQGHLIDALKIFEELSENPLARLFAGAILEDQGRFLEAIAAYNDVLDKSRIESHRQLALFFKLRAFYKSGDFLSAGELWRTFRSRYPQSALLPRAVLLQLLILQSQARYDQVLATHAAFAQDLKELEPKDAALVNYIAAEARLNQNQPQAAITAYQQALAGNPAIRPACWLKLAYAYYSLKDWQACYRCCSDYLSAVPRPEPLVHVLAAKAGLETGHDRQAFQSVSILAGGGDPLAELAWYLVSVYALDKNQSQTLLNQWAVVEKKFEGRRPAVEYRQIAAWSRLLLAEAYFRTEHFALAREYYQKALLLYPYNKVERYAFAGLTWCSFKLEDFNDVLDKSARLLSTPDVPQALAGEMSLLQAHAYFNLQYYDQSIPAYRRWLAGREDQAQASAVVFQIGWAQYLNKAFLDAVETWKDLARRYPDSPETPKALAWVADTYFQAGESSQARDVYVDLNRRFPDAPERKAYELRIAQTYYNEQKDPEAIKGFMFIMETFPDTDEAAEARKGIESASYRIADRINDIEAFRGFIAKFPGSQLAEDIQYRIGEAYYQKEKPAESLQEFLNFVLTYTKSPRTPNAQYYLAVCQEALGNTLEAMQQADAFVKNYPQHELAPEMLFRLASNEYQLEKFPEAATHFMTCAETYPLKEYQPRAWFNAAVIYEKLKQPEQALDAYQKLAAAYPADANTPFGLSRTAVIQAGLKNQAGVDAALLALEGRKDAELLQKTHLALAALYQEEGADDLREGVLKKIMLSGLPKSQDYSLALIELASFYEQKKAWAEAVKVYRRLMKATTQAKWRDAAAKRVKLLQRILKSK